MLDCVSLFLGSGSGGRDPVTCLWVRTPDAHHRERKLDAAPKQAMIWQIHTRRACKASVTKISIDGRPDRVNNRLDGIASTWFSVQK